MNATEKVLAPTGLARQGLSRAWLDELTGLAFVSPWVLGFLAFTLFPMAMSLWLAFTRYDLLTPPRFIGLDNFRQMLTDPRFLKAVSVTVRYALLSVPVKLAAALLVAMLLAQKLRGIGLYRVVYYLPSLVGSSVAVAIMWRKIFARDGLVNAILGLVGIRGPDWLTHPSLALYTLAGLSAWQFGSSMVIFLAGLKQIPGEYYEAAAVDGSNRWHMFWRITLPLLSPVIFFNLVMQTINAFQVFTQGFLITNGGPMDETLFYSLYLYQKGFRHFDMGYASAMAWVLLVLIAAVTAFIFKSTGRLVYYEADAGEGGQGR